MVSYIKTARNEETDGDVRLVHRFGQTMSDHSFLKL